jgi:hypothetical protein
LIRKTVPTPVLRSRAIRRTPRFAAKALLMATTLAASQSSSRRLPKIDPLLFRSREPSEHPLSDHGPLELGKYTHHLETLPGPDGVEVSRPC